MSRDLTSKDLAYEAIAGEWAGFISDFDTGRRIQVLVHSLLCAGSIAGKRCLEVGCGLGYFTRELQRFGPAALTAVDISPTLVARLAAANPEVECLVGDAMDLSSALHDRQFDVILSSEVIEHTPDPARAFAQMAEHLAPGGRLVVSVPSRRWKWLLVIAQTLGLRKGYQGFENWVSPGELKQWARENGLSVLKTTGIHSVPWHLSRRLTEGLDGLFGARNYSFAVNLAILAERPLNDTESSAGIRVAGEHDR
jgi:2-polyprenyl-6-hydroxyphenyl methylase/3-demethylubiquinone-9 3-methyltransferase